MQIKTYKTVSTGCFSEIKKTFKICFWNLNMQANSKKNPILYHMYHIYFLACHLDFCSSIKNSEVIKIYYFYIPL